MLDIIKSRCYISSNIFDKEIESLIGACILDCIETGISKDVFEKNEDGEYDDLILNCITNYVKANRGNDRTNSENYMKMYISIRNKLSLLKDYVGEKNE